MTGHNNYIEHLVDTLNIITLAQNIVKWELVLISIILGYITIYSESSKLEVCYLVQVANR